MYESRAYTGSNMLSRITEAALATMVLAVVNQHHARLHTPLQVTQLPLATICYQPVRKPETVYIAYSSFKPLRANLIYLVRK